jgi:hypothetical protein
MACKCIDRQRKFVAWACRKGMTKLCERAQARLARMEAAEQAK